MAEFVIVILCVFIITSGYADLKCNTNEVENSCPSNCELDSCPKGDDGPQSCEKPKKCEPACKCQFNFRRADNGTCISTRKCPPFPCTRPNEEFMPCPPYCPSDDCSQATPSGMCPLQGSLLLAVECTPACRCKQGYWRLQGVCVPYDECPNRPKGEEIGQSQIWVLG